MAIKSKADAFGRRRAIRHTWGNITLLKNVTVKRIFLLANNYNKGTLNLVELESAEYEDIVLADFYDSFRNLTLKELMFLRWFTIYCPRARFVFKGDDDVFANIFNIVEYLSSLSSNKTKNFIAGSVIYPSPRITDPKNRYYVSEKLYSKKYYPPYVSGGGFLMSAVIIQKLYKVARKIPLIPIDDAFIGVCLEKLEIKPENHNGFKNWGGQGLHFSSGDISKCILRQSMVWHSFQSDAMMEVWMNLTDVWNNFSGICTKIIKFVADNSSATIKSD